MQSSIDLNFVYVLWWKRPREVRGLISNVERAGARILVGPNTVPVGARRSRIRNSAYPLFNSFNTARSSANSHNIRRKPTPPIWRIFANGFPATRIVEISEEHSRIIIAVMVTERKLAIATIRRRFACLRALFRWIAESEMTPSPFATWRRQLP